MITTPIRMQEVKWFDITYADISNSGGCFFFGRGYSTYLQQQTTDHEIFAKEGLQKHLAYCHDRFSELANWVLSNYQHINTTCTDILNHALIKQMIVSGILHTVKNQNVQVAHAYWDGVSFGISDSGRVPHVKKVSVFCMPVRLLYGINGAYGKETYLKRSKLMYFRKYFFYLSNKVIYRSPS
jgi:hypothetical protein